MSRVCDVCGKGKMDGKTVSHANNKAPRKYNVNLQSAEIDGKKVKACTKCIRTSKKAQFWLDTWNKKDLQFASLFFVNQSAVGRRFALKSMRNSTLFCPRGRQRMTPTFNFLKQSFSKKSARPRTKRSPCGAANFRPTATKKAYRFDMLFNLQVMLLCKRSSI